MIKKMLNIKNFFTSTKTNYKKVKKSQKNIESFKDFLSLARIEMDKNGLLGWGLELDFAKVRAGACHFGERKISFSRHFLKNSDKKDIKDTVLHEIAHALVGPKHGHDNVWKNKARELGCSAQRCHSLEFSDYKWIRFCSNGCWEQKIHRKKSNLICKKCSSAVQYKPFIG
ncbi:SprT-like domain-containing protein [Alphaproteobacteria bacterium]|jgi:predicted SprT family Zn-dependent metalloprotease|nr:SprT-like domain-containing protein [Alphaproteobacteria bacterium]|tara:strand:- start:1565 stop:2077 length:513 start_codon:yes stop_codon:yes gene_type:complete